MGMTDVLLAACWSERDTESRRQLRLPGMRKPLF
jgi:hypothetical protein